MRLKNKEKFLNKSMDIKMQTKNTTTLPLRSGRGYKGKTDLQRIRGFPLVAFSLASVLFGQTKRMLKKFAFLWFVSFSDKRK